MNEIVFIVEEVPGGGYTAYAPGHSLVAEGMTPEALRQQVREVVALHFDPGTGPAIIRLRFIREEAISA